MTAKKTILIAEDEKRMRKIIRNYLKKAGFQVEETGNGKKALELIEAQTPDLLILDLMLPGLSGEKVCQHLRQKTSLPILMVTAKSKLEERLKGLELGADDYLVKPFNPREMVARVKAILRRTDDNLTSAEVIVLGNEKIKIYPKSMTVKLNDQPVDLTTTEFNLLYTLIQHPQQVMSREQLVNRALGMKFDGFDRTIDVHIKNIRKKLNLKKDEYIHTVYGQGYKFTGDLNPGDNK